MIKIIRIVTALILLTIISLIIIFGLNPFNLRTKIVGSIINSYLTNTIPDYQPIDATNNNSSTLEDKHPLLNQEQEEKLEELGVNIEKLPPGITPGMQECFIEKLGQKRADEIAEGDTPTTLEFLKSKECIGK